jgi:hypothetical protein
MTFEILPIILGAHLKHLFINALTLKPKEGNEQRRYITRLG